MEDDHVGLTMEQDNYLELAVGDKGRGAGLWDGMQAVFGPGGPDGYPKQIWDKATGVIDPEVAKYWREHADLSYIMRRDWTTLGPKLVGKIHLTVGTADQWYLANAVRYVEAFLKSTKDPYYDGSVEYGDRFIHCYQGDPGQPLGISSRTVYQREMPAMATHAEDGPVGVDVKSGGISPTHGLRCVGGRHMVYDGCQVQVMSCDTTRPPATARPRGRRASPPAPRPSAIGTAPSSAAIVVIMIGRNRIRQPW